MKIASETRLNGMIKATAAWEKHKKKLAFKRKKAYKAGRQTRRTQRRAS